MTSYDWLRHISSPPLLFMCCFILCVSAECVMSSPSEDASTLLDYCIDSQHHKQSPSPEPNLTGECAPWRGRSCCHAATADAVHAGSLYNFNFHHCANHSHLSSRCLRFFRRDHCFFECSPNVGPWRVAVDMKSRNESFERAPLCAAFCRDWFDACRDDYTCAANWMADFSWSGGRNRCRRSCVTFGQMYGSAVDMCQQIWNNAWHVVETGLCFNPAFEPDSAGVNPNRQVAAARVQQLKERAAAATAAAAAASHSSFSGAILLLLLPIVLRY